MNKTILTILVALTIDIAAKVVKDIITNNL
jgi:hypothetical protein